MSALTTCETSRALHARFSNSLGDSARVVGEISPMSPMITEGRGARLWDEDGNCYVDYLMGMGPLLLGHTPKAVFDAVRRQLDVGIGYGKSHRLHGAVAEAICRTVPSAERCLISNTGTEAVQIALRLARAATGRTRIIKFAGHYHGWCDPIFVGIPRLGTAGQDPAALRSISICEWNHLPSLEAEMADDVAAVIMEPITANGGCLKPTNAYITAVRELTRRNGSMLIFDETVTGYRLGLGGAQENLDVSPDLTILGKALGGGFPISAVCGPAEAFADVMSSNVLHLGTYNANVVSAAAALAMIESLEADPDFYRRLDRRTEDLAALIDRAAASEGVSLAVNWMTGFMYVFLSDNPVTKFADVSDLRQRYPSFARELLANGVHAPSIGVMYVTAEHGEPELEITAAAFSAAARAAREQL